MTIQAAILGGSGYIGGELMRLLHFHPNIELDQVFSRSQVGKYAHSTHPNLRGTSNLQYQHPEKLRPCDVLFLALPHGEVAEAIQAYSEQANVIIDCSADFRLRDPADYQRWYGYQHPAPQWLQRFVYGLPERHRADLPGSSYASGVGCNATVLNLALGPLVDAGMLERVVAEIKVGSSEAGSNPNPSSHHPERSGTVRVYSTHFHRHLAEVEQELGPIPIHLNLTAIEMVRGVHLTAHCFLRPDSHLEGMRQVWSLYRQAYGQEPFIRLVTSKQGLYRLPEPKILAGSNYCDIGFSLNEDGDHLVVIAALDNLMKGGAGSAVQSMNLMLGFEETAGLTFPGLHPI
jgi:N-acetyl-gamma-glutamyl-phosphate/LysW-gamma-L-alpha-aminoadipyl-6-phosphate reductase